MSRWVVNPWLRMGGGVQIKGTCELESMEPQLPCDRERSFFGAQHGGSAAPDLSDLQEIHHLFGGSNLKRRRAAHNRCPFGVSLV